MELQKKKWENKRVYALGGGWRMTGIAKKCKNKRADAFNNDSNC